MAVGSMEQGDSDGISQKNLINGVLIELGLERISG
jgi:hypothetical protein